MPDSVNIKKDLKLNGFVLYLSDTFRMRVDDDTLYIEQFIDSAWSILGQFSK